MKKKLTITIASILSVIVIIGVGFAAWVITNPEVKAESAGEISVETVTDKSYSLTAAIEGAISFGAPKTPDAEATKGWLKNDAKTENLEATLTLTLDYKYWSVIPENLKLKIEAGTGLGESFVKDTGKKFEGLVEASILKNPTISYDEKTNKTPVTVTMNAAAEVEIPKTAFGSVDTTDSDTAKTATATIKITFGWGTAFGSENPENPYNYYNKRDYSTELAKEANEKLTKLYNSLNGVSYKVIVTGTTAAA